MSKYRLLIPSVVALVLVALTAGCGSDDEAATAQTVTAPASSVLTYEFSRCPFASDVEFSAGNWAGSVAGDISCDEAGRLIQDHFNRDFGQKALGRSASTDAGSIRESDPSIFTSAGFECAAFPLPDGMGWHLLCGAPDAQVSFYFTP